MYQKRLSRWIITAVFILVLVLTAAGCSAASKNQGTTVNVKMTNFAFQIDKTSAPSGKITFHVTNNESGIGHEMVVLKTDLDAAKLPRLNDNTADESKLDSQGEIEVEMGSAKDLTLDLTPGHYVLLCNVAGHYEQGMAANFTVN